MRRSEQCAADRSPDPIPYRLVWKRIHGQRVQVKVYAKPKGAPASRRVEFKRRMGVVQ